MTKLFIYYIFDIESNFYYLTCKSCLKFQVILVIFVQNNRYFQDSRFCGNLELDLKSINKDFFIKMKFCNIKKVNHSLLPKL